MIRPTIRCLIVIALSAILAWSQSGSRTVHGTVRDQAGAVIPDAQVTATAANYKQSTRTNAAGDFDFQAAPQETLTISVDAQGFGLFQGTLSAAETRIDVVLKPATVAQEINVTANRFESRLNETAESITVLSSAALERAASETVDDTLREVAGFTLFRRSGSRTANPTSQGVSLRGIGATGASRALVLYDGIPLNDPFGGWVYWGRVPREAVGSIEVLRGGASSLYGSSALGGVVSVLPRSPGHNLFATEMSFGSEGTPDLSAMNSLSFGNWALESNGEVFRTGGYVLVPESQRGTIDTVADSYHQDFASTLRRKLKAGNVFATGSVYNEARNNGTQIQTNDTQLWETSGGADLGTEIGHFQLRGYGNGQSYNQTFSSIAANRNSESLVNAQHVPAQRIGGSLLWAREFGWRNSVVAGADSNAVRGFSNEETFAASRATSRVNAGGHQLSSGAFVQDLFRISSRVLLTLDGRYDHWSNYDAHSQTVPLVSTVKPSFTAFTDVDKQAFSPRAALLVAAGPHLSLTGSFYKSFRAPTLNELYRSFRVGNTLTLSNSLLTAERLSGAESGANLFFGRTRLHAAFFWMQVSDPIANVTLSTTPTLITNQRQNLGRTRSRGVEVDGEWHIARVDLSAGYQFVDAVVTSFAANPRLVGLDVPQVAPHQFTWQASWKVTSAWTAALQGRTSSSQFEDDLNTLPLDSFFLLDAYVSRRFHNGTEIFAAVENLTDSRIVVGRTPVTTIGPPIFGRIGIRLHFE